MRSVGDGRTGRYEPSSLNPSAPRKATARLASTVTNVALGKAMSAASSETNKAADPTRKSWLDDPAHRRGQRLRRADVASYATTARPLSAMNRLSLADEVSRKRTPGWNVRAVARSVEVGPHSLLVQRPEG